MATVVESIVRNTTTLPEEWSLADLRDYLGGIPPDRIRLFPFPGTASEDQAVEISERGQGLYELVDGILVEKPTGQFESFIAGQLLHLIQCYLDANPIGVVYAPDGPFRLRLRTMRLPDVAYVSWDRFPARKLPTEKVVQVPPDLVAEVLSDSNTKREMKKKLAEYFQAGTRLVWYIDPQDRTATIYTAVDQAQKIDADGILEGRDVLPGFTLRLGDLFARAEGPTQ